jgi:hypothetical protein
MSTMYVNNIAPLEGNTINVASGNILNAPGSVTQVIKDTTTSSVAISAGVQTDVGLSITITPTSSSSKFLILTDLNTRLNYNVGMGANILRSSDGGSSYTNVMSSFQDYDLYNDASSSNLRLRGSWSHLDSPSTTNQLIYKIQVKAYASNATTVTMQNAGPSNLTVMEIAG